MTNMTEKLPGLSPALPDAGSYHDLRSLNSLRNLAQHDEKAALRAAAKQFESVFMQQLLKSMREANEVFEDDDFFGRGDSEVYEQMHDEQMALSLANNQSFGLADLMVQQLSQTGNISARAAEPPSGNRVDGKGGSPLPIFVPAAGGAGFSAPLPPRPPVQSAQAPKLTSAPQFGSSPTTPASFVQAILPHAEKAAGLLGVDPAMLVAQAALETGWGSKVPTIVKQGASVSASVSTASAAQQPSHQYFGIKADSRWTGVTASAVTLEYLNGLPQRQRASFRAYETIQEAFADYAAFIQGSPRYADAVKNSSDPAAYAKGLQSGGYATDPDYASKLIRVFNSDNLKSLIDEARKLL